MEKYNQAFWNYYESPERQSISDSEASEIIQRVKQEHPEYSFEARVREIRNQMKDLIFKKMYE